MKSYFLLLLLLPMSLFGFNSCLGQNKLEVEFPTQWQELLPDNSKAIYVENEYLNSLLTLLVLKEVKFSLEEVILEYKKEDSSDKSALDCIQGVLNFYKLNATNYTDLSKTEIVSTISSSEFAILELQLDSNKNAYSAVFIQNDMNGSFDIYSYPELPIKISSNALTELVFNSSTTSVVIINNMDDTNPIIMEDRIDPTSEILDEKYASNKQQVNCIAECEKGKSILYNKTLNLGALPRGLKEAVGEVEIKNAGENKLIILSIKGACSCFRKAVFDRIIEPGESTLLRLYFDLESFAYKDAFKTELLIMSNDENLPVGRINVIGDFDNEGYIFLDPISVDFGRIGSDVEAVVTNVNIYRKVAEHKDAMLKRIISSSPALSVESELIYDRERFGDYESFAEIKVHFNIKKANSGKFSEKLRFVFDDKIYKYLEVDVAAVIE